MDTPKGKKQRLSAETRARKDSVATLPSVAKLKRLPRWAIVAFVARCARRCQPLLPGTSKELTHLAENAIGVAEEAAQWGMDLGGAEFAGLKLVEEGNRCGCRSDPAFVLAVGAALVAALANIGGKAHNQSEAEQADGAMAAVLKAAVTGRDWRRLVAPMARDFDRLRKLAKTQSWDGDSRVAPGVFGEISAEA